MTAQREQGPKIVQRGPRILRGDLIERLVAQGRIPQLHEMLEGRDARQVIVCFVPPEGTQIGDTEIWLTGYGPGYKSTDGQFRGRAEDVGRLTPSQAEQIVERIEAVRASLGL